MPVLSLWILGAVLFSSILLVPGKAVKDTEQLQHKIGNDVQKQRIFNDNADADDMEVVEDEESVLQRDKRQIGTEITLSREHHPMEVTLVQLGYHSDHHRVKRTSFNTTADTWPHRIPYVIDGSYNKNNIHQLQKVLAFLENHLCVEFQHEQGLNTRNPNWLKEHGYSTNAYIRFWTKQSCVSVYGRGEADRGPRNVSPCNQLFSMMHEVLHSLGGIHSQNYPYRERYITVHDVNIDHRYRHNYKKSDAGSGKISFEYFDPSSLLMYGKLMYSRNGRRAFDYIRPEMSHLAGPSTYGNILLEMTKNYKCQEKFCGHEDLDCGNGYMGYVDKRCSCVCPDGFDPQTRCKDLINKVGESATWPEASYTILKEGACPDGMQPGEIPIAGQKPPRMSLKAIPAAGNTLKMGVCMKTVQNPNLENWPMGSYCIGKVQGVPCSSPFKEGSFTIGTRGSTQLSGSVGDVTVNGNRMTIKFCCRREGDERFPMQLPTDQSFRLLSYSTSCQAVDGMWAFPAKVILSNRASKSGSAPRATIKRSGITLYSCYYQPPKYDCNENVHLDASNPSVNVSVPASAGGREANKRCFYSFRASEKSRLRLTINTMSLHPQDKFLVKRFNLLQNPYRVYTLNPPHQMITENNILFIEYWSFLQSHRSLKGATFTVDLLPAEDLCYDVDSNGADYAGDKSVSETYEECVPWAEATSCPDFPWSGTYGLSLLNSGKSCRNLDTHGMLQPWCYTSVNGALCNKRYCDVCNEAEPVDLVANCQSHISKDPDFCSRSLGRFGCFKSCGMDTFRYNTDKVKCSRPAIPQDLLVHGQLHESYDLGDSVSLSCNGRQAIITCTPHGWTPFSQQCSDQECIDASQLCQNALVKFPGFCSDSSSKATADKYCRKSCGLCSGGPAASCRVSTESGYSPVARDGRVSSGQNVIFACNVGLTHISGDMQRACGLSGQLLGQQPTCEARPTPADINIHQIVEHDRSIPSISAYLMLGKELEVPFDGKITEWFFYCKGNAAITLLVYRRVGNSKQFKLIGSNTATCVPKWSWASKVPSSQQITVRKGDVLGVYNRRTSIRMQPCGTAKEASVPVASTRVRNVASLLNSKVTTFSGKTCAYVALGARIVPSPTATSTEARKKAVKKPRLQSGNRRRVTFSIGR